MPAVRTFDVAVIGGGPAGYTAAIRASQLGAKAVLVEKHKPGGACLHYACIPTKFLRYTVEVLRSIEKAARYGISAEVKRVDWPGVQARRQALIDNQGESLGGLLEANGVEIIHGEARLISGSEVAVRSGANEAVYNAGHIVVATGSLPARLNIPGAGETLSARALLQIPELPRSLAVIGGGPVGVELATIFSRFGVAVSIIEMMPQILPEEDGELVAILEKELKKSGVRLYTGTTVQRLEKTAGLNRIFVAGKDGAMTIEAEAVAICAGQKPNLEGIGLPEFKLERGALSVDEHLFTGVAGVYAAGDVTGKALLAYVAIMQGKVAAENALGLSSVMEYTAIPRCVFSLPELSSVGLTEAGARAKGYDVQIGRFPFAANAAATIQGERRGMVKVIAERGSGRLLGAHILGSDAPVLIHEAALAVKTGAAIADIQHTLHAHPNLAEAFWEAALDVTGEAISFK